MLCEGVSQAITQVLTWVLAFLSLGKLFRQICSGTLAHILLIMTMEELSALVALRMRITRYSLGRVLCAVCLYKLLLEKP